VAEKKLKFPGGVEMLITISAKQSSKYPGGEWTGAKGDTHLINARIIKGMQNAPKEGWSIEANMWATEEDGVVDLLRTFTLTDGDLEKDLNKYFTATPQDLKANEDSTRFRFTFSVTCELADLREAAWVSLKSKESP
jgi:hypothetical protein